VYLIIQKKSYNKSTRLQIRTPQDFDCNFSVSSSKTKTAWQEAIECIKHTNPFTYWWASINECLSDSVAGNFCFNNSQPITNYLSQGLNQLTKQLNCTAKLATFYVGDVIYRQSEPGQANVKYLYEIPICKQANAHFPVNRPLLHTLLTHEKLNSPISCKFEMQLKESSPMTIFSGTPEAKSKQWNS
jgi:hypothetical protein